MTIYERKNPSKIPNDLYELFLCNDGDVATQYGNDIDFLKRNNAEFD